MTGWPALVGDWNEYSISDEILVPFTETGVPGRRRAGLTWWAGGSGQVAQFSFGFEVPKDQPGGGDNYIVWQGQVVWTRSDRSEGRQVIGVDEVMRLKEIVQAVHMACHTRGGQWGIFLDHTLPFTDTVTCSKR